MIHSDYNITDDLLVKYVLGEVTAGERVLVEDWAAADERNAKQLEHFRLIWNQSRDLAARSTVDPNAAWQRFQTRVSQPVQTQPQGKVRRMTFPVWTRIAAAIAILIGSTWLWYTFTNPLMQTLQANGKVVTQKLADGSVVTLNKNATLYYPETFKGNERHIKLEGEAFFEIAPDKTHPFIIDANEAAVKVVGTSFNVKTSETLTEVIVETGIVEVSKKKNTVQLTPHEKATVRQNEQMPEKQANNDELYNYYHTRLFVCNNTPLGRFVHVLNEAYDVNIVIADPYLAQQPLTSTFKDESLDNILRVIGETFNITVSKNGSNIVLK